MTDTFSGGTSATATAPTTSHKRGSDGGNAGHVLASPLRLITSPAMANRLRATESNSMT